MTFLETGERALRRWRRESLAGEGTYVIANAGRKIENLLLTQAETATETIGGEVVIHSRVVDFIVDVADMMIVKIQPMTTRDMGNGVTITINPGSHDDVPVIPQPGDRIEFGENWYEVCSVGGRRAYEIHGRDGGSYRIHTNRRDKF